MMPFQPDDWYWIVGGDQTRVWSSRSARYYAASNAGYKSWLAGGGIPTRIDSEESLWEVLNAQFPAGLPADLTPPVIIPKRVIVDRLHVAGKLEAAKAALDAADLYTQERWNTRTDIYADDPTALAMCQQIGVDPAVILAQVDA